MTTAATEVKLHPQPKLKQSRRMSMKTKRSLIGLLFVSPWLIGFLALVLYPLYRTIFMSFHNVSYGLMSGWRYKWVGLENYTRILFEEIDFVIEAQNYFVSTLLYVPVIIALSIIIAVLLNQPIRGKSWYRLVFFLPVIILNGELMDTMSNNGGMSIEDNRFILEAIYSIIPNEHVVVFIVQLFELIVQLIWYCAVPVLIFLASLQKINKDMYEAAAIDGASPWTTFWKITLPTIYPLISTSVIYVVVFLANFDLNPINTIIMESKYDGSRREGYASALSLLYSGLQIALIAILYLVTRTRKSKER